eukprot:3711186-Prymnesium_polylepis.2
MHVQRSERWSRSRTYSAAVSYVSSRPPEGAKALATAARSALACCSKGVAVGAAGVTSWDVAGALLEWAVVELGALPEGPGASPEAAAASIEAAGASPEAAGATIESAGASPAM